MSHPMTGVLSRAPTKRDRQFKSDRQARSLPALAGYDLWAASYDDDPNPLLALEGRELRALLPDVRGKDILDLGCGTGRWLSVLAECGARSAVGIDFSAAMIDRAAAHPSLRGCLVRADCLALPLQERVADLIVCSFTVGHVADVRALARELSRVARHNAELFVTDMHPEAQARGWRCGFRHESGSVEISSSVHTQENVRTCFESGGFRLVQSHDLWLGEPEKGIFARAGKKRTFEAACAMPAVLVLHLKRD